MAAKTIQKASTNPGFWKTKCPDEHSDSDVHLKNFWFFHRVLGAKALLRYGTLRGGLPPSSVWGFAKPKKAGSRGIGKRVGELGMGQNQNMSEMSKSWQPSKHPTRSETYQAQYGVAKAHSQRGTTVGWG